MCVHSVVSGKQFVINVSCGKSIVSSRRVSSQNVSLKWL